MDIKINVYCGLLIENRCRHQLHPINEVNRAKEIIELNKSMNCYSNSPDFVSAIKYMAEKKNISVEFFLDDKSCGDDIEPIFEDFNKSYDIIDDYCDFNKDDSDKQEIERICIDTQSLLQWRYEQKQRLEWWCKGINIHCIPLEIFMKMPTSFICKIYNVELDYFKLK